MAEPEGDLPDVSGGLKGMESARVAQGVGCDGFARKRGHSAGCGSGVQSQSLGEAAARQPAAKGVEEEMPVGAIRPDREPVPQRHAGGLPQRQDAPAAALAQNLDAVQSRPLEVVQGQAEQFRDPQAGIVSQAQHGAIAPTGGGVGSRGVEQGPDLVPAEIVHRRQVASLDGQGTHLRRQVEPLRVAEFQIAEEGLDRGQAHIAGPYAVVAVGFEMIEKGEQRGDIEMPDLQLAGRERVVPSGEDRQQLETGGVARDGVRAGTLITRQVLAEEGCQRACEIMHRRLLPHAIVGSLRRPGPAGRASPRDTSRSHWRSYGRGRWTARVGAG